MNGWQSDSYRTPPPLEEYYSEATIARDRDRRCPHCEAVHWTGAWTRPNPCPVADPEGFARWQAAAARKKP